MDACKEGKNKIMVGNKDEHYGRGNDVIKIELPELFQLYNQDTLDKSVIHAYCL
jgi:hypothetical protein